MVIQNSRTTPIIHRVLDPLQGDPLKILEIPEVISFDPGDSPKFQISISNRSKVTGAIMTDAGIAGGAEFLDYHEETKLKFAYF